MKKFLNFAGLRILPMILNIYIKTLRIKVFNTPTSGSNYIYIFWHSKMLLGWWLFRNKRPAALVSQSRDGDILNKVLSGWNYRVIRGSSSKGGKEAVEQMIEMAKNKYSAVITPDGPKGPVNEIKNGALIISSKTGIPIIPVKIIYSTRKILVKSWDKFEVPLPFSKCEVYFGDEHNYEKYLEGPELDVFKNALSKEM